MLQPQVKMKKPVEIWQAVIATFFLLVTVVTIIVNQSNRITRDEGIILMLEKNNDKTDEHFAKTDQQFDKVNDNLEKVNSRLTDILVQLQNKQNRK